MCILTQKDGDSMESGTFPVKVYAKLDANNNLLGPPASSIFLQDATGWTQIDEGSGDKYIHAQGNYLPGPAVTKEGIPRYHWDGEKVVERTPEEIDADIAALPSPPLTETALLKAQVQALTERGEFLEDVIAELAMMVL